MKEAQLKCAQKIYCVYKVEKVKVKVTLEQVHDSAEGEKNYSSTLPSTSVLNAVGDQRHAPAALPPRKTRYPLYRRLDGPQGKYGQVRKISPPPGYKVETYKINLTV